MPEPRLDYNLLNVISLWSVVVNSDNNITRDVGERIPPPRRMRSGSDRRQSPDPDSASGLRMTSKFSVYFLVQRHTSTIKFP